MGVDASQFFRLQRRRWRTHLVFTTVYYGGNGVYCLLRGFGKGWAPHGIGLIAWVHSEIDLSVDSASFKTIMSFLISFLSPVTESVRPR